MVVVGASKEYNHNAVVLAKNFDLKITLGLHPEIFMQNET
jgi:Tat protein secretion system quality control protein TatD with DNase activity